MLEVRPAYGGGPTRHPHGSGCAPEWKRWIAYLEIPRRIAAYATLTWRYRRTLFPESMLFIIDGR